jgi:hypothetical protein
MAALLHLVGDLAAQHVDEVAGAVAAAALLAEAVDAAQRFARGLGRVPGGRWVQAVVAVAAAVGAAPLVTGIPRARRFACGNLVTDPYSLALTTDSLRSVVVDLNAAATKPPGWDASPRPARGKPGAATPTPPSAQCP